MASIVIIHSEERCFSCAVPHCLSQLIVYLVTKQNFYPTNSARSSTEQLGIRNLLRVHAILFNHVKACLLSSRTINQAVTRSWTLMTYFACNSRYSLLYHFETRFHRDCNSSFFVSVFWCRPFVRLVCRDHGIIVVVAPPPPKTSLSRTSIHLRVDPLDPISISPQQDCSRCRRHSHV